MLSCVFSFYDLICLVSPPPHPLPMTFDPSDFETSVDSRCTTDSADSAFFGRRYWFPASAFSPFLSSNHPLPSPPTQEVRFQISQQDKKTLICLFFWFSSFTCRLVVVRLINSFHLSAPISTNCPLNCVSYLLYSSNMYYSYFYSLDASFVFVCSGCIHLKQSCMMLHNLKSA